MIGGLAGSVFAGSAIASHKANVNTTTSKKIMSIEKNQDIAWLPLPGDGPKPR